ncbi:hypothetical protein E6C76_03250 [Pseudothauera nasutitermitis]|uniref:BetI-type transcriptional repressor C-terminal domain-containing protein n=1 Tax=Pseudothauera nasutitermitis TaxID=2565930 RepID=A0A4S4B6E0_9RHOO|nr:hypothetical protein E6C76_03250 [Pseudothauera nasutitermitis]
MLEGLLSHVVEVSIQFSRLENARLRLEILSEATRNTRLARIVRDFDQRTRESMLKILKRIDESRAPYLSGNAIESRLELLSALVSGFLSRAVKGGHADEHDLRKSLRQTLRFILMSDVPEKSVQTGAVVSRGRS